MSYGMETSIGICFQNSYGTALTSSMHWISQLSEDVAVKKDQIISEGMRGVFDEGAHYEGLNTIEGGIEAEAHPISIGALLRAAIGAPTTVTSAAIYTHTFKPATADFDVYAAKTPITIVKHLGDAGSAHRFYDMVANDLELSCSAGEFLKIKVGFMGGKYDQVSEIAASYPTGDSLFTWNVASMSVGGAAVSNMSDWSLKMAEKMANKHTLNGARTPSRTKRDGFRSVEIAGTLIFDDQAEYQQFLSQSEREMDVTLKTASQIQSGYYETLRIQTPKMRYTEFPPTQKGVGQLEVGFSAKGVYSVSSATALQVTLINSKSGY